MVQRAASATAQLLVVKAWSSMITNLDYSRKEPRRMMSSSAAAETRPRHNRRLA